MRNSCIRLTRPTRIISGLLTVTEGGCYLDQHGAFEAAHPDMTADAGRPAFEKAGVIFTDQVHAFEAMKIRILNGGHALIAYPAGLLDIEFAHDAIADPLIAAFLRRTEEEDILPHVPPVPGTDIPAYLALIEKRIANPDIGDTVRRLCLDGSNRQPKFIVPSLRDNLAHGRVPGGLVLISALWCRYCHGQSESGAVIAPNDPAWEALTARAEPREWLGLHDVYGDLAGNTAFARAFADALQDLWSRGTRAVVAEFCRRRPLRVSPPARAMARCPSGVSSRPVRFTRPAAARPSASREYPSRSAPGSTPRTP